MPIGGHPPLIGEDLLLVAQWVACGEQLNGGGVGGMGVAGAGGDGGAGGAGGTM